MSDMLHFVEHLPELDSVALSQLILVLLSLGYFKAQVIRLPSSDFFQTTLRRLVFGAEGTTYPYFNRRLFAFSWDHEIGEPDISIRHLQKLRRVVSQISSAKCPKFTPFNLLLMNYFSSSTSSWKEDPDFGVRIQYSSIFTEFTFSIFVLLPCFSINPRPHDIIHGLLTRVSSGRLRYRGIKIRTPSPTLRLPSTPCRQMGAQVGPLWLRRRVRCVRTCVCLSFEEFLISTST